AVLDGPAVDRGGAAVGPVGVVDRERAEAILGEPTRSADDAVVGGGCVISADGEDLAAGDADGSAGPAEVRGGERLAEGEGAEGHDDVAVEGRDVAGVVERHAAAAEDGHRG